MKNNLKGLMIVICIVFQFKKSGAQFIHEHTYTIPIGGEAVFITDLGNNNLKYVMIDYYGNEFSLFNLDHSSFISNIQLPLPTDSFAYYQVGYITSSLFDCDSSTIEYALMNQFPDNNGKFMVYRTDGTQLFSRDSVSVQYGYGYNVGSVEIHGIENTPAGTKLFLFNQNREIFVYSLCGILPDALIEFNESGSYVQLFPNPSTNQVNFQITCPNKNEVFDLTICDLSFKPIKTYKVSDSNHNIFLNNESLSSGSYIYYLKNRHKIFQTGKFLLIN